jgi:hypothetical protein
MATPDRQIAATALPEVGETIECRVRMSGRVVRADRPSTAVATTATVELIDATKTVSNDVQSMLISALRRLPARGPAAGERHR